MNKINKLLIIFIGLIIFINPVNATATVFNLPDTDNKAIIEYDNNIQSEFITIDTNDAITELDISLKSANYTDGTALRIDFENNITYTYIGNNFLYLGILPYREVTQTITFQNYTIFNKSSPETNILNRDVRIQYKYTNNKLTSIGACDLLQACILADQLFTFDPLNVTNNTQLSYNTYNYIGLPSYDLLITGLTTYSVKITYQDLGSKLSIENKKSQLSSISKVIYAILNTIYRAVFFNIDAESETLIDILLMLDYMFWLISFVLTIILFYPYLILVWILIFANLFVAWKSTSVREIFFNYSDYFKFVGNGIYQIIVKIWDLIVKLIEVIRG